MDYIEKVDIKKSIPKTDDPKPDLRIIDTDFEFLEKPQIIKKESSINKRNLINKINYKNFQNESIRVNFFHNKDKRIISLNAIPQPCFGKRWLVCG